MKHGEIQELFLDYSEGLLAADERLEIQQHLRECTYCSEAFKDYQRIASLSTLISQSSEPLHPSLAVKVMELTEEHAQLALGFQPRRILAYLSVSAFASVLVLAVLISDLYTPTAVPSGTSPLVVASIPANSSLTNISKSAGTVAQDEQAQALPLSMLSLPSGFRAVSIKIDRRSGVEGWAKPNSRVDVLWTYKEKTGETKVASIVRYAKILSAQAAATISNGVNQISNSATDTVVTLLANETDAKKIELARTLGTLTLSLVGDRVGEATKDSSSDIVTVDSILGTQSPVLTVDEEPVSGRMYTTDSRTGRKTLMVLRNGHWKAEKVDPDSKSMEK